MRTKRALYSGVATAAIAVFLSASPARVSAQQTTDPAISIGNSDLGGVVTGPNGPEAGVWVIAETNDLPSGQRVEVNRLKRPPRNIVISPPQTRGSIGVATGCLASMTSPALRHASSWNLPETS